MNTHIIVFAKAPVAGRVKTRLIPALGEEGAAALAREMLDHTLAAALEAECGTVELCMDPAPGDEAWFGILLPEHIALTTQGTGDLGQRMARAAERSIGRARRVLLIGTDCVEMSAPLLRAAAQTLDTADACLHPTVDGGYALLGLTRFDYSLFDGIAWSTSSVAEETCRRIEALGWTLAIGANLHDVDLPSDLALWRAGR